MPRYEWDKFYHHDWHKDLRDHPLAIEGAWIRIISARLWWSDPRGRETLLLSEWSKLLGTSYEETCKTLSYLMTSHIADVEFLGCNAVTPSPEKSERNAEVTHRNALSHAADCSKCNAHVTITSRRIFKAVTKRDKNRIRQQRFREKQRGNAPVTPSTPNTVTGENTEYRYKDSNKLDTMTTGNPPVTPQENPKTPYSSVRENQRKTPPLVQKLVAKTLAGGTLQPPNPLGSYTCKQCGKPARLLMAGICQTCYRASDRDKSTPSSTINRNDSQTGGKP